MFGSKSELELEIVLVIDFSNPPPPPCLTCLAAKPMYTFPQYNYWSPNFERSSIVHSRTGPLSL